jgi:hypothetical protein
MSNNARRAIDRALRSMHRLLRSLVRAQGFTWSISRRRVPLDRRVDDATRALHALDGVEQRIAATRRHVLEARVTIEQRLADLEAQRARHSGL